jgi:hypothetical protein
MDKDRITGAAHRVRGAVKETVGKVTGDAKTRPKVPRRKRLGRLKTLLALLRTPSARRRRSNCSVLRQCTVLPEVRDRNTDIKGRIRVRTRGGTHGSRHPALVVGCTHSDHHPARSDLALI